jgi:hypothetical protein
MTESRDARKARSRLGLLDGPAVETVTEGGGELRPQRLLRIASVGHEVLEEAHRMRPERGAVAHLGRLHDRVLSELRRALPTELFDELEDLTPSVDHGSLEELTVAMAEILGWLEGLFQGTQLALQLEAARAFREQLRSPSAPPEPPSKAEESSYL